MILLLKARELPLFCCVFVLSRERPGRLLVGCHVPITFSWDRVGLYQVVGDGYACEDMEGGWILQPWEDGKVVFFKVDFVYILH